MNNTEKENAIKIVLDFTSEMNAWEQQCHYRKRYEHGYEFTKEKDLRLGGDKPLENLLKEYYPIFEKYCTQRERKYGGQPYSFGNRYMGIDEESILEVNIVNPKTIEVICQEKGRRDTKYKFVLFKRSEEWLIDNAYWEDNNKWERHHL